MRIDLDGQPIGCAGCLEPVRELLNGGCPNCKGSTLGLFTIDTYYKKTWHHDFYATDVNWMPLQMDLAAS